jgi:hypothetical protein
MKKVKFGNNEIFDHNGKTKKTRLYPMKRSNKNEKIKTISKSIIRKYYKKIIFYYYYKKLKYEYELLFSKLTDDDPITNKIIQDIINTYNDIILDVYYT